MKNGNAKSVHGSTVVPESGRAETCAWSLNDALTYLKERSDRGRAGAVSRGGMCSRVAYGYVLSSSTVKGPGAQWEIAEDKAAIVREIFRKRAAGSKLAAIADDLNCRRIESPQGRRIESGGQWRASTVGQILRNKIYRGVYTFFSLNQQCHRGKDSIKDYVDYPRQELRLVSDELWFAANQEQ